MSMILPKPPAVPGLVLGTSPFASGDLVWRSPGATNLLRTNQASFESGTVDGWEVEANCTIAASTTVASSGTYSLALTSLAAGTMMARMPVVTAVPVVPGRVYTAVASERAGSVVETFRVLIYWFKADGTSSSTASSTSNYVTDSTSAWATAVCSAVAPSDAAYARVYVQVTTPDGAGQVHYFDKIGLWEGPGGTWAIPGAPIQGIGTYWDESVGRRCFAWDQVNARWQMVYGDTGWRSNPGWFGTDWDESSFHIRRIGWQVQTAGYLKRVTASGSVSGASLAAIPTGWRSNTAVSMARPTDLLLGGGVNHNVGITSYGSVGAYQFAISVLSGVTWSHSTWAANDRWHLHSTWETVDAWPTALPGTASGTIPTG